MIIVIMFCRFLSEETNNSLGSGEVLPSVSSTVSGDEDPVAAGTYLAAKTDLSPQMKVITPLYSNLGSNPSSPPSSVSTVVLNDPESSSREKATEQSLVGKDPQTSGLKAEQSSSSFQEHVGPTGQFSYQLYPLDSTPSCCSGATEARSSVTTASEIDFRNNLACLDADIARLQMQFQVALQSPKSDQL